ncbi:MAG: FAD-dependent oxidoreductase, partial [Planctomycetes bacterium]|nr:FAD-dependent oxidoreductase [Planctomycetota bacterium]
EAYETIRKANIFPEVCAWLCPVEQQCQGNCLQKFIGDGPLPIADIQRYLAEKANRLGWSKLRIPEKATGKKIAIIGAGPAGLSAAAVLLEAGHSVTILDRHTEFGGMIESVIPPQRQRTALKNEIKAVFSNVPEDKLLVKSGVELSGKYNLDAIENEGFDAVFIGMGLPESIKTSDENLDGQYDALEFLSLAKQPKDLDLSGKRVAVIGGGNTAMDAAATAGRLGAEDVYLIYRRSFEEMPAWSDERDKAVLAGVHFVILTQQLNYLSQDGKVTGINLCPCQLGDKDLSARRTPLPLKDSSYTLDFDIVVEAIGQRASGSLADMLPNIEIENGLIKTNPNSLATSRENVFAGGDITRGPSTVVAAVADGMKAAKEIDKRLR